MYFMAVFYAWLSFQKKKKKTKLSFANMKHILANCNYPHGRTQV